MLTTKKEISLNSIENLLQENSILQPNDYSLYRGKTGACILYYILANALENQQLAEKAFSLLNEISENVCEVQEMGFGNGLSGIGWGIEWLVQNGYVDANTDEMLEDLDDELYKSVIYSKAANLSLYNGTLGKSLYFYRRYIAQNYNSNRYRNLCNQECLVLLTDEIQDFLLNDNHGLIPLINRSEQSLSTHAVTLSQCLVFMLKIIPRRVNIALLERCIGAIIELIEQHRNTNADRELFTCHDLLYAYALTGIKLNNPVIKEKSKLLGAGFSLTDGDGNVSNKEIRNRYIAYRYLNLMDPKRKMHFPNDQPEIQNIFDLLSLLSMRLRFTNDSWNEALLLS